MSAISPINSRGFAAKTLRVVSLRRIDASVDLDFGVSLRRTFIVDGVPLLDLSSEPVRELAKRCMIMLVGGKRLFVRPDPSLRDQWSHLAKIPARVYLTERVHGRPIGYIDSLPDAGGSALELGPYLSWLAREGFDVDLVKETMNGPRT